MFCLVTNIVGSDLKSKNQEVSGFSDQWVLNVLVDFNEMWHKWLPTLLFERPKFQEIWKSRNLKISTFKKSAITFAQGCTPMKNTQTCSDEINELIRLFPSVKPAVATRHNSKTICIYLYQLETLTK